MKTAELTQTINAMLNQLETKIKSRPQGGDTVSLRRFMDQVIGDCQDFKNLLDRLDETPNFAPTKALESYYTNGLSLDPLGGA